MDHPIDQGLHFRKIPTVFVRDFEGLLGPKGKLVTTTPHEDAAWVLEGCGVPTRKLDGTCCWISEECQDAKPKFYKRLDVKIVYKKGKPVRRETPPGFVLVHDDETTGHRWGWVPVDETSRADKWHMDALLYHSKIPEELYSGEQEKKDIAIGLIFCTLCSGTYELIGPKIQSNKEKSIIEILGVGANQHVLMRHGEMVLNGFPDQLSFETLKKYFENHLDIEGIVWHFPQKDGTIKMAKLKGADFGVARQ